MRKIFSKTAILLALALLFAGCQKPHLSPSIPDTAAMVHLAKQDEVSAE